MHTAPRRTSGQLARRARCATSARPGARPALRPCLSRHLCKTRACPTAPPLPLSQKTTMMAMAWLMGLTETTTRMGMVRRRAAGFRLGCGCGVGDGGRGWRGRWRRVVRAVGGGGAGGGGRLSEAAVGAESAPNRGCVGLSFACRRLLSRPLSRSAIWAGGPWDSSRLAGMGVARACTPCRYCARAVVWAASSRGCASQPHSPDVLASPRGGLFTWATPFLPLAEQGCWTRTTLMRCGQQCITFSSALLFKAERGRRPGRSASCLNTALRACSFSIAAVPEWTAGGTRTTAGPAMAWWSLEGMWLSLRPHQGTHWQAPTPNRPQPPSLTASAGRRRHFR